MEQPRSHSPTPGTVAEAASTARCSPVLSPSSLPSPLPGGAASSRRPFRALARPCFQPCPALWSWGLRSRTHTRLVSTEPMLVQGLPGQLGPGNPCKASPHSLPACRGQPGSPGPADKCLGQHRTGQLGPRMQRPCKQSRCPRHGARQGGGVSGQHLNQLPDSRSQIQSNLVRVSEKVI